MLVLASNSPRRRELLRLITSDFEVFPVDVDEHIKNGAAPGGAVMELARKKARAAAKARPDAAVIGADTVVVLGKSILGKPGGADEACAMLRMLSGRTHTVYTGVCIIQNGDESVFFEVSDVTFAPMGETEIAEYAATGEPFDKAGAYGVQGAAARFISGVRGDFYNIMGLPVCALYRRLKETGCI